MLFEEIIVYCQKEGQLAEGKVEIVAVKLWSLVHGFSYLVLENQFPKKYAQNQSLKELLNATIAPRRQQSCFVGNSRMREVGIRWLTGYLNPKSNIS
jgi:hypothetical protein